MQVSIEHKGELGRELTITLPVATIKAAEQKKLQAQRNKAQFDGFRPGKVPMRLVTQRYGEAIHEEVVSQTLSDILPKILETHGFHLAMPAKLHTAEGSGEHFVYKLELEVLPEVDLSDFSAFQIEKPIESVLEADIDSCITEAQETWGDWEVTSAPAQLGDKLTIDFVGTRDGIPFEGGSAEGFELILGSSRFIPGFESGLVGASAQEIRTLDLVFPEDYEDTDLAGQAVQFSVKIDCVSTKPILSVEAVAQQLQICDGDLESQLRTWVHKKLSEMHADYQQEAMRTQAFQQLLDRHDGLTFPPGLLAAEEHSLQKQEADAAIRADRARHNVLSNFLIHEIARVHDIHVPPELLQAKLSEVLAKEENQSFFMAAARYPKMLKALGQVIFEQCLKNQVCDHIIAQATVTEKLLPRSTTQE